MFSNLSAYNLFYLPMLTHILFNDFNMNIWGFPKIGVPQNGWFIRETLIKMDDLGVPPIFGNTHFMIFHVYFAGSYNPWSWPTPRQLLSPWRLWAYSRQVQRLMVMILTAIIFFFGTAWNLEFDEIWMCFFFKFGFQNENWGGSNWWGMGFCWIHFLCRWEHGLFRRSWTSLCGCQNS